MAARAEAVTLAQPVVPESPADLTPAAEFTDEQNARVQRAKDAGIWHPVYAMQAALWADVPYYVLCAYLEQEATDPITGKHGANLWGSDPTWMRGVELRQIGIQYVSREAYLIYRLHRADFGAQGVGGLQLTHPSIQARADMLGGCWHPLGNYLGGAELIADLKAQEGNWHDTAGRYNGSGPDGAYADHNDQLRAKWKPIINP